MRIIRPLLVALACAAAPVGAVAQESVRSIAQSPILILNQERLFRDSEFGRRILLDFEARRAVLAAENRAIEEELTAEERQLTELRLTIPASDFRERADVFDAKVVAARDRQDDKERDLSLAVERGRRLFFRETLPVLARVVREAGALAILDSRTVILSSSAVDVTDVTIRWVNEALGSGPGLDMVINGPPINDGSEGRRGGADADGSAPGGSDN